MAQIDIEGVTKRFGTFEAVRNMHLTVGDGEFFAVLGPSGCGKTTTLRMLAGLERVSTGRIRIGDRDVTDLPPNERNIGMVFQDYALYPHMKIGENVGYPLKVRRIPRAETERRVREFAGHLQIERLLERLPSQISGGQQQRAALGRAIITPSCQAFLLDEPLSNLDAKLRLEARAFLKRLQRELRSTTVYVTHDQAEAMALADRIAIMHDGVIVQLGTPREIYFRPATTFVANFIGSPPMNLMHCRVRGTGTTARLVGEGFETPIHALFPPLADTFAEGEEIELGVRPEHLSFVNGSRRDAFPVCIRSEVFTVEPMGAETIVTCSLGDGLVTVRLFGDNPIVPTGSVEIAPNPTRLYLYRREQLVATSSPLG